MWYKILERIAGAICNLAGGATLSIYCKNTNLIYLLFCSITFIAIGSFLTLDSIKESK